MPFVGQGGSEPTQKPLNMAENHQFKVTVSSGVTGEGCGLEILGFSVQREEGIASEQGVFGHYPQPAEIAISLRPPGARNQGFLTKQENFARRQRLHHHTTQLWRFQARRMGSEHIQQ